MPELNRRAGLTRQDDHLPKWMMEQAIPENGAVFDISEEVLNTFLTELTKKTSTISKIAEV